MRLRACHWSVYLVASIAMFSIASVIWRIVEFRNLNSFERHIEEAGGAVHWAVRHPEFSIPAFSGYKRIHLFAPRPTKVEISTGSHPIPKKLAYLSRIRSVKELHLNTNQAGDFLVPTLASFTHLEILDLTDSEFSGDAAMELLEALPELRQMRIDRSVLSESQQIRLSARFQ